MTDLTADAARRFSGRRIARVEDGRLLTGHGSYVDDVTVPGMLHAYFVRSPYARARIRGIDTSDALGLPGVKAVLTARDLNAGVHEQWHTSLGPDSPETRRPPLAEDEVRFVGDPIVVVLAEDRYLAEDAGDLVVVDFDPLPAVVDYLRAEEGEGQVHPEHATGNLIGALSGPPQEPVEESFSSADHVVTAELFQGAQAPCPIETRGLVASYSAPVGDLTIWAATQTPHNFRGFCARMLDMPEHRVRVIMRDTGGGFGQKVYVQREEMAIVLAAVKMGVTVKWIEDRRENLLAAGQSRHESAKVGMAFDSSGAILAAQIDFMADCGSYPSPWPVGATHVVGALFPGPYRVPNAGFRTKCLYTNTSGRTPYRGPWLFETFAREVLLDTAARQMDMDPVDLRRRNVIRREDLPYLNPCGLTYDRISPCETLEQALEKLDYSAFRKDQQEAWAAGRYIGVGTASYVEPTAPRMGAYGTEGATIRIEPSGKINVYIAGGSTGNSLETTVVQLAADALGANIEDVHTIQGDTAITGYGPGAVGSRSGPMMAGAVDVTAAAIREKLVALASHMLEADPSDVELGQSRAYVRGTPSIGVSFGEVAALAYYAPDGLPPGVAPGLEATERYAAVAPFTWANATHVCTCEVDIFTGKVTLLRYIVSEDCGPMINPNVVEGQIAGGTVQGIAGTLYEKLAYDQEGNPLSTTFMDYLIPTAAEIPVIEYCHVDTPAAGPGGYKGVGEGGAIGAPAAVANAIADALSPFGVRVTRLPLTPDVILDLIGQSPAPAA